MSTKTTASNQNLNLNKKMNKCSKISDEDDKSRNSTTSATEIIINNIDYDDFSSSASILEFLNKEQECCCNKNGDDCPSEIDVESIFEEINRLTDYSDERPVDEILREAESLLKQQQTIFSGCGNNTKDNQNQLKNSNSNTSRNSKIFNKFDEDDLYLDSVISQESAPKDLITKSTTLKYGSNDDSEISDTVDDLTEGLETISIKSANTQSSKTSKSPKKNTQPSLNNAKFTNSFKSKHFNLRNNENIGSQSSIKNSIRHSSENSLYTAEVPPPQPPQPSLSSPSPSIKSVNNKPSSSSTPKKNFSDKSTNSSPKHYTDVKTSPIIDNVSITREYALKIEIDRLQEKLKDTEERLQSLRIQHDSLSQIHRDLRDTHTHLQDESELLKLDVQHLTECANILRSELQSARNDRKEALEIQKTLQSELEESKLEKKKAQEQCEKDAKIIQDLQRQCKEMERILMRKHPDSVSGLIVASKNKGNNDNSGSRKLLEQRIAQLEADAKDQDLKAQKILANVQARFNSVQAKYETHIADLETQVLSLQEINAKLNEKIELQIYALDKLTNRKEKLTNDSTQTDDIAERDIQMKASSTQTDNKLTSSSSMTAMNSSTMNSNRQIPIKKTNSKISASHSETTISAYHAAAKEDAHLLATIRGMRVDLAIKDKAMQRLTRELDECKKTIKKLQKEKEAMKNDRPTVSANSRKSPEQMADSQALKEALNKIKLLEFDYKALHDKRLQDLKTLQAAHERELASCQETVRILQQRSTERDENFSSQKRRKVPIDYYALKAKVSSLERRHSEREQRLHMLVEALSKGRLNGALEEILNENTQ